LSSSLYKYCVIDKYTMENLFNNQLYFSVPKKFNDPYEGIFNFNISNQLLADKLLRLFYEHKYQELIESKKPIEALIRHTMIEYVNQFLNEMKICCLSHVNDSLLMWAHYSGNHKGICIESDNEDFVFKVGSEVNYSEDVYKLIINSEDDTKEENLVKKYSEIVATKFLHWQYEEEYRLFSATGESKVNYSPHSIKSIYFGLRCTSEDKAIVMSLLKQHHNVRYYQADLHIDSYKIRFIDEELM